MLTARQVQRERYHGPVRTNADLRGRVVTKFCSPDAAGRALLHRAVDRLSLSARGYDRVLKVARTIADLAGADALATAHVAEAIQYRGLDRQWRP